MVVKSNRWLEQLGPGLITGAADDDPSGIATYSQAGAQFGYQLGWTLALTYPLMVGIQMVSARMGRVTGHGLASNVRSHFPRPVLYAVVVMLVVANTINIAADIAAMGEALRLVIGGPMLVYAILFGVVCLGLQVFLRYQVYVRYLKWLTLALLAYVAVVFTIAVPWREVLLGLVWPKIKLTSEALTVIVAVFGTTISPYLFFWQAAQEVEELNADPAATALRLDPADARAHLHRIKFDTYFGMGFSNLIAFFMMVATAATLHATGITHIETTAQAAQALAPVAGRFAFLLFALGVVGTGLLALPVLAGSAAYAVASLLQVRKGLDQPPARAKAFYAILAAAIVIGLAISASGLNPIKALYWSAVVNAVISVPVMVAVMIAASHARIVGALTLPLPWRVLGWLATAAMAAATLAMFAAMV